MAGCYRCGSTEGSDVRPCPTCQKSPSTKGPPSLEAFRPKIKPKYSPAENILTTPHVLAGVGVFMVLSTVAMFNWSMIKVYTGNPSPNDLYKVCMSAAEEGIRNDGPKDGFGKAIFAGVMVEMCSELKKICEQGPDGQECQKLKQAMKLMARS